MSGAEREAVNCPFCGASASVRLLSPGEWIAECSAPMTHCRFGPFVTKAEAVAVWNRRVPAAPESPREYQLAVMLATLADEGKAVAEKLRGLAAVEHLGNLSENATAYLAKEFPEIGEKERTVKR